MGTSAPESVEQDESVYDQSRVNDYVQRVVQSATFAHSETLKRVLLYLWEHQNEETSEYAIATEALGRRPDFDPKLDASVRVQIARLRRKLKDYYESETSDCAYILNIPVGSHRLTVQAVTATQFGAAPADGQRTATFVRAWALPVLGSVCAVLLVLCTWLLWDRHEREGIVLRPAVIPTRFWNSFVGTGTPIKIILPTPLFFNYPKKANIHIRDINIYDFLTWKSSAAVASFAKEGGTPTLDHSYTVTSDTLASIDLARYLDSLGIADRVTFAVSDDSTMDLLEKASVVAFGAHSTLYPFRDYLTSMNFSLGLNEAWIENAHPAAGELPRYTRTELGGGRAIELGIVGVLPGRRPNTRLLIIQSFRTAALVSMLTSQVGDDLFEKMYIQHGSPKYFEMAVEIEVYGDHVIRSWPVALHAYTGPAPAGANVTR